MAGITSFTQSSGNSLVDALTATSESLSVPAADRPNVAGTTAAKWGGGVGEGVTLTYSFGSTDSTFSDSYGVVSDDVRDVSEVAKQAFRSALAQWSNVVNVQFQEVTETTSSWGDLRFFVSGSNPNQSADTAGAEAAPPASSGGFGSSGAELIGDIVLTPTAIEQWDFSVGGNGYRTVLHELGHAVFNIPDVSTSAGYGGAVLSSAVNYQVQTIMSYSVVPGATAGDDWTVTSGSQALYASGPMVLDTLAAQYLYGANSSFNTGNDVYVFSSDTSYVQTIWDAGGTDTIQYVSASEGGVIDLRPGAYSELGQPLSVSPASGASAIQATVGIAYGAVIENAIGGAGADQIIGNEASNSIHGAGGDDTVAGGAGADAIYGNLGSDVLYGNTDSDSLFGGQSDDTVFGGQQADLLYGNLGSDVLYGNLSSDTLYGGQGADTLYGGQGDDFLFGNRGDDILLPGLGADIISVGGGGDDTVFGFDGAAGDRVALSGTDWSLGSSEVGETVLIHSGGSVTLIGVAEASFNLNWIA